jgi:hypothetical protein
MRIADCTNFNHGFNGLTRIKNLCYIFGMVLLFGSFGNNVFGCCFITCAPCEETPNLPFCTTCIPTGNINCGHGCCSPTSCNNNTCCPPEQPIGHGYVQCVSGWCPLCCPSAEPEYCDGYGCYDSSTCERVCENGLVKDCGGDPKRICCNGTCCDPPKCCDNGVCKDPMCDNCHLYSRTFNECLHYATDQNGTPCSTDMCISNVLIIATCDIHDSNCPSKCTAKMQAAGTGCMQSVYICPCAGGYVDWHQFVTIYTCCGTCTGWNPGGDSCLADFCVGALIGTFPHGALWDCTGTCP